MLSTIGGTAQAVSGLFQDSRRLLKVLLFSVNFSVVEFFAANSCKRPVSRQQNRIVRAGQDF